MTVLSPAEQRAILPHFDMSVEKAMVIHFTSLFKQDCKCPDPTHPTILAFLRGALDKVREAVITPDTARPPQIWSTLADGQLFYVSGVYGALVLRPSIQIVPLSTIPRPSSVVLKENLVVAWQRMSKAVRQTVVDATADSVDPASIGSPQRDRPQGPRPGMPEPVPSSHPTQSSSAEALPTSETEGVVKTPPGEG